MANVRTLARRAHLALPPGLRSRVTETYINVRNGRFRGSDAYWKRRYAEGGDSGTGSAGRLAQFKADVINDFIARHGITTVIEFGCGDGRQASLFEVDRYLGLDISPDAVVLAAERNSGDPRKSFLAFDDTAFFDRAAVLSSELALSLDVLYHLTEPATRDRHLRALFDVSTRFVMIYSTDPSDGVPEPHHVHHWPVADVVADLVEGWSLVDKIENEFTFDWDTPADTSSARFYVYEHTPTS